MNMVQKAELYKKIYSAKSHSSLYPSHPAPTHPM